MNRKPIQMFGLMLAAVGLAGCISINALPFGANRGKVALEIVEPAKSWFTVDQVLLIPLSGFVNIGEERVFGGEPGMLVALKDRLATAEKNDQIRAVILRIDSPGGSVTAADLIYHELLEFKKRTKLPIVAMLRDTAASGGLYIAMAADEIYAIPTTVTGSIGAILVLPCFEDLGNKIGIQIRSIKSGENKDAGAPWKQMGDEQRAIFQGLIDGMYRRFRQVILESREKKGMTAEQLDAIADGRVLDPQTALESNLIDGIGYSEKIVARARELAGIQDAAVVSYEYRGVYRGHIEARQSAPSWGAGGDINLFKLDMGGQTPFAPHAQFMYLWMP